MTSENKKRPGGSMAVMNKAVGWLARRGISMAGAQELSVTGRRSGRTYTTPVNPMHSGGELYLVSPRGEAQWVRNARVNARVSLRVGGKATAYTAVEVPDDVKVPLLRAYLKRWGWQVKQFFEPVTADATDAEFASAAPDHPVFRLERVA